MRTPFLRPTLIALLALAAPLAVTSLAACDDAGLDPTEGEGEGEAGEGEGEAGEGEGEGEAGEGEGEGEAGEGEGEGEGEGDHGSCGTPLDLQLGDNSGNLNGAPNGTDSFCVDFDGGGGEDVWTFTTDGPQELTLTLSSGADLGISVREDCSDGNTELDCADFSSGGDDEEIVILVEGTVTVIVEGFLPGEAGAYTLNVSALAVVCGDGEVAGDEECDGLNLDGLTCNDLEFGSSGDLVCNDCVIDASACVVICGDNVVGGTEVCDLDNFDFQDCNSLVPGTSGTLVCAADCATVDSSGCAVVCGDGVVGEAEECDDMNLDDGDGCSAGCVLESCLAPPTLDSAAPTASDLTDKPDLTDLSCTFASFATTPEEIFTFDPGGAGGDLTVTLSSDDDVGVAVRTTCAAADSELDCRDSFAGGTDEVVTVSIGGPVFVIVESSGFADTPAGAYSLSAAFVPSVCPDGTATGLEECDTEDFRGLDCNDVIEGTSGTLACDGACLRDASGCAVVCGDGLVGEGEECDDTNNVDGDGCSAACIAENCIAPLTATVDGPNDGDTTGASNVFRGTCTGSGGEQVWEFTPDTSGFVKINMTSALDLGVYVRSACGDENSELGCTDAGIGGDTETVVAAAEAGVPIFIVVDSFSLTTFGAYSLTIEFLDEVEPNNTFETANAFVDGFDGIVESGDTDCVSFNAAAGSSILVDVEGPGCPNFSADSELVLFDTDGTTELARNDDSLDFCSTVESPAATGGTYFACVLSSQTFDPTGTFSYTLVVTVTP